MATGGVSVATQRWSELAAELTPAKSVDRIIDARKSIAGSVSLIGAIFTGIGLVSADRLRSNSVALGLGGLAGFLAVVAILIALRSQILRVQAVRPENLIEVERWYKTQVHRGEQVRIAGICLFLSVSLGAAAAGLALITTRPVSPALSLQLSGAGSAGKLSGKASMDGLAPGLRVETRILGIDIGGKQTVLLRENSVADNSGKVDVSGDVTGPFSYASFRLEIKPVGANKPYVLDLGS